MELLDKTHEALKTLDILEKIVYDNEEKFLEEFGYHRDEIIYIRFHSVGVEWVSLTINGTSIINGINIEKFIEWLEKYNLIKGK